MLCAICETRQRIDREHPGCSECLRYLAGAIIRGSGHEEVWLTSSDFTRVLERVRTRYSNVDEEPDLPGMLAAYAVGMAEVGYHDDAVALAAQAILLGPGALALDCCSAGTVLLGRSLRENCNIKEVVGFLERNSIDPYGSSDFSPTK